MPSLDAPPAVCGAAGGMIQNHERGAVLWLNRRLGWLLRTNRLFAADGRWWEGKRFASAFDMRGKATGGESRISRWETGAVRPTHQALTRYEELLELEPGSLTSVVDTVIRYTVAPGDNASLLSRTRVPRELFEELIERALSTAVMNGAQWDLLTSAIASCPEFVLAPRSSRAALGERLLSEMIIGQGRPWRQRFEALNRLLNHPTLGQVIIETCSSLGADPANQVFIETIGALDGTTHPEASQHVLAQLTNPTNERALQGALIACHRKIRFRHFTPEQVEVVSRRLGDLRSEPALRSDVDAVAVALRSGYRGLGLDSLRAIDQTRAGAGYGAHFVASAARIAHASTGSLAREVPQHIDDLYRELVVEMLCHPSSDTRLYTAMLVGASPYRRGLAETLTRQLAMSVNSTELRVRIISSLRVLGGQASRPEVERCVLAEPMPSVLVRKAAFTVGHLAGASTSAFWRSALARHTHRWRQGGGAEPAAVLSGLVYSLGVAGQRQRLVAVRDDRTSPLPARGAAQWWLNLPEHIYRSAAA